MTIESIKNTIESIIPEDWEYAHDMYIDTVLEDNDYESLIAEGCSENEIAQEIIDECIRAEQRAFEKACDDIYDAKGVIFDEDGINVSDEVYTMEHCEELRNRYTKEDDYFRAYEREVDYMWSHR